MSKGNDRTIKQWWRRRRHINQAIDQSARLSGFLQVRTPNQGETKVSSWQIVLSTPVVVTSATDSQQSARFMFTLVVAAGASDALVRIVVGGSAQTAAKARLFSG
jgi:hypothetical protein